MYKYATDSWTLDNGGNLADPFELKDNARFHPFFLKSLNNIFLDLDLSISTNRSFVIRRN
jgi:hypothetical protein